MKLQLLAGPRLHDDRRFAKQLLTDLDDDGRLLALVVLVEDVEVVVSLLLEEATGPFSCGFPQSYSACPVADERVSVPGLRSFLGTRRAGRTAERYLVNIDEIPFLEEKHRVYSPSEMGIGGDAPKNYIEFASHEAIAKAPRREGPIECVTEYLIARIGRMLPLRVAVGSLVQLPPAAGAPAGSPPDVRFLSRVFLNRKAGEQLVHGSQLVARCFDIKEDSLSKEIDRSKEWSFYTIDLLNEVFCAANPAEEKNCRLRMAFGRMMAFDALIGANDRHPQNWGVIESAVEIAERRFAPIYDTARGLFWNSTEDDLAQNDRKGRASAIQRYAGHSYPLIGMTAEKRPNHFDVVAHMMNRGEPYRRAVREVVRAFSPDKVARMMHREFRRMVSRQRLEYIDGLLRYRRDTLKKVCGV